ncbi:Hypothetical predicted protein [Olea europaea subsp. europaea]|uniref:Uncharacterized protein n=1 Tax=Olea europaea subsp. europaea TaxID=158383 RepID=A0A8S0PGW0_OLEEU|nr:Hypothetical predicted protein [Olea europaea subsp. europaea]
MTCSICSVRGHNKRHHSTPYVVLDDVFDAPLTDVESQPTTKYLQAENCLLADAIIHRQVDHLTLMIRIYYQLLEMKDGLIDQQKHWREWLICYKKYQLMSPHNYGLLEFTHDDMQTQLQLHLVHHGIVDSFE